MFNSSPEKEDFPGRLLHQAALWDNTELLEDLIQGGEHSYVNSQDNWGRTPLHAAAITEKSGCLQILLNVGADANISCGVQGGFKTPLHVSAEHGHERNALALILHNANWELRDAQGMVAVELAEKEGHVKCAESIRAAIHAKEKDKLDLHYTLREACSKNDLPQFEQLLSRLSQHDSELIVNMAPGGANTLLFIASQLGNSKMVSLLLENGADGRSHPVTKYSPLYIACHCGHRDIVESLLIQYPQLVQQHTVERWLPIHAATINGHTEILKLLFQHAYPEKLKRTYRDCTDEWQFRMAFDINERDASGKNILYMACLVGNRELLDIILKHKVVAERLSHKNEQCTDKDSSRIALAGAADKIDTTASEVTTPSSAYAKRRISDGIQSILCKLSLKGVETGQPCSDAYNLVSPLRINMYCSNNTETALHAAVKGRFYDIVQSLLIAGSDPNLPIKSHQFDIDFDTDVLEDDTVCIQSTALVEACKCRDGQIIDLLLKYGARDDDCHALHVAYNNSHDENLISKLLCLKAHPDAENKLFERHMNDSIGRGRKLTKALIRSFNTPTGQKSGNYGAGNRSSLPNRCPENATMINWHNLRCNLSYLRTRWLIDASLHVNQRLKGQPENADYALFSITRLDLSNNALTSIPRTIFCLINLRYLNLAQNKLEKLPLPEEDIALDKPQYNCLMLEELYLQENRLDQLPSVIFQLPSLVIISASHNKLQTLPYEMWLAPNLTELNVSHNLLKDLPGNDCEGEHADRISISSSDSHLSAHSAGSTLDLDDYDWTTVTSHRLSLCSDRNFSASFFGGAQGNMVQLDRKKHHLWPNCVEISEQILHTDESQTKHCSKLSSLNLSHNLLTGVPVVLPCLAVNLTRLNLSFNSLRTMSYITNYPSSLKQLDAGHNEIRCWPSLPQMEVLDGMELANITCYASCKDKSNQKSSRADRTQWKSRSLRSNVLQSVCSHRRHLRLENLRTLILTYNKITRIQLSTADDEHEISGLATCGNDDLCIERANAKLKLMFPNLSMLDVSNNNLKEIPTNINELTNLSVLNVSCNADINELPPQMGLLSRLWNLNTHGCSLQEPLKSMIESKKYKTMDIIGYLKSVLEDAQPYTRMKLMIVGVQEIGKTSLLEQLRQEGFTRRKSDHWAKRIGNKNINLKTAKGCNISTVGVDIGDWIYEKKVRNQISHGPVTFRTWDFGGQKEYYATHQYFLSKRSIYLVVWKITDGHRAIAEILQWLVNIQARAPNSPVIIVGTHYDVALEDPQFRLKLCDEYQQIIRERFINIVDAEKCGLPRVLDTIQVSCKTKYNIKALCNLIYDTVFSLRPAGNKELLLEQKVPATYLALEDIINQIAVDRRANGLDPVLTTDQYRAVITAEMQHRYGKGFRDWSELHQATLFLHDNGVLLHYDDASLKDLYFLDPQWLCDMLAHVVTIREINPFARTGVMKFDDLKIIFKNSVFSVASARNYVVNLLNKFEVALSWDARTLLIPALLPTEEDHCGLMVKIRVPERSRGWAMRQNKLHDDISTKDNVHSVSVKDEDKYTIIAQSTGNSITRLLIMSYFPSGFWSRLISRILADDGIVDIVKTVYTKPKEKADNAKLHQVFDLKSEWILWQTGLQLMYGEVVLFRMREVAQHGFYPNTIGSILSPINYRCHRYRIKQDGVWCDVDLQNASILEIFFPVDNIVVKCEHDASIGGTRDQTVIAPNVECITQLLAMIVDHTDILLEDWYPTLGTRFVHTSEGKFLITRLIPCPYCLDQQPSMYEEGQSCTRSSFWSDEEHMGRRKVAGSVEDSFRFAPLGQKLFLPSVMNARKSQDSCASECDSGVGHEDLYSGPSSRMPSVEGYNYTSSGGAIEGLTNAPEPLPNYSWMVEECILAATSKLSVTCPTHADVQLKRIAPDTIFGDLPEQFIVKSDNIKRGQLLGRGSYGFVFRATCKIRKTSTSYTTMNVAMKMLQPIQPDPSSRPSAIAAHKAAKSKWDRDPLQYACKAYCTARQELNILLSLRHPNIVPFVGLCINPLALILDLAPQGALDQALRVYRRSGAKLESRSLQAIILQVAKAIEYLHRQRIIYRDLKAENVLVWHLPFPYLDGPNEGFCSLTTTEVLVKLADYGISRLTLPSGTKGFGGTEGFMAPEIIRHNGEEEYTEKVDCFSFGMFIYELVTLRQPFEGHESVKECILDGGRPTLTNRDTQYPSHILDLMVLCWSQQPNDRPSASQIVSIASAPEFIHLSDALCLRHESAVQMATAHISSESRESEIWIISEDERLDLLITEDSNWLQYHNLSLPMRVTATCTVSDTVWMGDAFSNIHAYSTEDGAKLFSYSLDNEPQSEVTCLLYISELKRVVCSLSNGRLFLINSEMRPSTPTAAEGSFVLSELATNTVVHCLCYIHLDNHNIYELWCGVLCGQISIFSLKEPHGTVANVELINHFDPVLEDVRVSNLISSNVFVWSYVQPGCAIYQWDVRNHSIINKLDCSKLVPCSESLKSIAIDEHLSPSNCQVTSMACLNDELYIGTHWGCVIIVEKKTLRPVTIFRPYEEEVRVIVPLPSKSEANENPIRHNFIATVGKGYRNLLLRYTGDSFNPILLQSPAVSSPATPSENVTKWNGTYVLLWLCSNWDAI